MKITKYKLVLVFAALVLGIFGKSTNTIYAQTLDLGVTPPITEVIIAPGADYQARYLLSNFSDSDVILTPKLYKMQATDEFGTAKIADDPEDETSDYYHWFSINGQRFNQTGIKIRTGLTIEVPVLLSIPEDTQEIDHYFSIVFASDPTTTLAGSGQAIQGGIATNMLIAVSKTGLPQKNAVVEEFSFPKIVDSFFPPTYTVRIKNSGNSFFKPIGDITTTGYFLDSSLKLAPQNILSGTIREIKCLDDEDLVNCTINSKFLLGTYKTQLAFTLDTEGRKIVTSETIFAFPFLGTIAIFGVWIFVKKVRKSSKKSIA